MADDDLPARPTMPADRNTIVERCIEAARRGDPEAQFQLGVLHCTGVGVPQDLGAATRWYRQAAEQGHGYAAHNLAAMLLNGNGAEPDAAEGFRWSTRAAEAGIPEAQLMLGNLYAGGLGTAADPVQAREWFAKAAAQGNTTAAAQLEALAAAPPDESSILIHAAETLPERSVAAGTGTLAIMTMVYNESFNLPIWIRHYRRIAPSATLFVIDHGSDDGSTRDLPGVYKIPMPRDTADEAERALAVSSLQHGFLRYYDTVIYTDCDELLVPDPAKSATLDEYLDRTGYEYASPIGLNVIHMVENEPPLDPTRPLLLQRRFCQFASSLCKPLIARVPLRWEAGFHGCDRAFQIDTDLYLFHIKQIDKDLALQRQRFAREMTWSQQALEARHGAHQRLDDERFVREFFIDPANELRQGAAPFNFTTEIARLQAEVREISGAFHVSGFRGPIVEIPERFRSIF
jgi:Sel1 repeat/Glycosyl transferase family 2